MNKVVVLVALAASLGNLLQGWGNATIAGSLLYIKKEFNLENEPKVEGLIVVMSLVGAAIITTCSGSIADSLGRRSVLMLSSVLYFLSGLIMFWTPNVYVLLFSRLLNGFAIGLSVTIVPVYISETSPPEIRGLLNTLPQFTGSGGLFLSYCMVFAMSLRTAPSWRLMLGVPSVPSLFYFAFTVFFLPESPSWLVSQGKTLEAKHVLQKLRGKKDVSGEMALLVEGIGFPEEVYYNVVVSTDFADNHKDATAAVAKSDDNLESPLLLPHQIVPIKMARPSESVLNGPRLSELLEPGVRHALIVGIGLQLFQQFSGINGVLYYTPQILEQSGVAVLLSNMGIGSDSTSLLVSGITALLMLPCIAVTMRLMDISGRRVLLLNTILVMTMALVILIIANINMKINSVICALLSTVGVVVYICSFVMGFGPIPNILCSEIFSTRVRGLSSAICSLAYWTGDITVTYTFPVLLNSIGLAGSGNMRGAVLVAIAASIGNMLQGWDNATIAGSNLYIKKEFSLESQPTIEGLIVAMSLIGATIITTCSGPMSDRVGRRPMLILSSFLYFLSGLLMLWAPNVYFLLLARLINGFGIGLVVTLVPVYISETAPPEIRGSLNTLPQFSGSGGMFLSYCMVFGMSLMASPSWRLMLGVLSIPSLIYVVLTIFFLPESPRWLVSKGKMLEAKHVLQRLRGTDDVEGEMALLVEGLNFGGEISFQEFIIVPGDDEEDTTAPKDQLKLISPEDGLHWVAKPVTALQSRQGSMESQGVPLRDTMVTLFDSIHEKCPEQGHALFSCGSMMNVREQYDEESQKGDEEYAGGTPVSDFDDNMRSPLLLSRQATTNGEQIGIGGGWQLAWKRTEKEGEDGKIEEEFKRVYLHQEDVSESRRNSLISLPICDIPEDTEYIHAAALVGKSMIHPSEAPSKQPGWSDLFEPGVKHALLVGIVLQILQQFSGISAVLYYSPQILKQAGVGILISNMGIGPDSASILISALTTFLMLPCIVVAMRLMDNSGRRSLLLTTIPVLIVSLVILVISNVVEMNSVLHAAISTTGVIVYICSFVMGFGPIPNILCSEIFPTRVRGLCIAICSLVFWASNIIVTYTLPLMLNSIGLAGVFSIYAVVCIISLVFVFLKVPETKGMPLEVISEFFAVGAKQQAAKNN
ncbi:hypothetical protein C5167_038722 [Papaver somniferum]|uniref:Major facilitator superfamily (MFS) profile domain-containing protein n=2 Tax=Papaver somniferum TaxID=3469 RepID=A0A4Y7IED2_PAPSO|nr:hypothetical protein C5167_038722 [Papaver somniferum]